MNQLIVLIVLQNLYLEYLILQKYVIPAELFILHLDNNLTLTNSMRAMSFLRLN